MDWNGIIGAVAGAVSSVASAIDNANGGNSVPVTYTTSRAGLPSNYSPPPLVNAGPVGDLPLPLLLLGGAVLFFLARK